MIDPAIGGGGLNHRIFAGNVIGHQGQIEALLDVPQDVEVGQRRLDHQEVGAFLHVEGRFAKGFAAVGRVHLVGAAVAEPGSRFGSLPERPVIAGCVFHCIAHDRHMYKPVGVQGLADCADPAVHHVRRRHHIRTRFGVGKGLPAEKFESGIVIHLAVPDRSAMAVVGVLAHADIGDDREAGNMLFQLPDSFLHHSVTAEGLAARSILALRDAEENDRRNSRFMGLLCLCHDILSRQLIDSGHGGNLLAHTAAKGGEHGVDQVVCRQRRFPHHAAENLLTPDSAGPVGREMHVNLPKNPGSASRIDEKARRVLAGAICRNHPVP